MPGPRRSRNCPTGVSGSSEASSSIRPSPTRSERRLDALVVERLAQLELGAEEPPVGLDGLVEIGDRDAEVVDAASRSRARCYRRGLRIGRGRAQSERCGSRWLARSRRSPCSSRAAAAARARPRRRPAATTTRADNGVYAEVRRRDRRGDADGGRRPRRASTSSARARAAAPPIALDLKLVTGQGRRRPHRGRRARLRHHPDRPEGLLQGDRRTSSSTTRGSSGRAAPRRQVVRRLGDHRAGSAASRRSPNIDALINQILASHGTLAEGRRRRRSTGSRRSRSSTRRTAATLYVATDRARLSARARRPARTTARA